MARPINRKTYCRVEWHLMHQKKLLLLANAEDTDDFLESSPGTDFNAPKANNGISDPTAKKALILIEEQKVKQEARLWLDAIDSTLAFFRNTSEWKMAMLYYSGDFGIESVAEAMGTDRNGVKRMRDSVVYRCAMIAAAKGVLYL